MLELVDNPGIVRLKIQTYYMEAPSLDLVERRQPTAHELVARIQRTPLLRMTDPDWAELYCDMDFLARQQGIVELEPLLEVVDDPFLAAGMRATLVDRAGYDTALTAMTDQLQAVRLTWHRNHALAIGGVLAIQQGRKPHDAVAEAQALAGQRVEGLSAQGLPKPTA